MYRVEVTCNNQPHKCRCRHNPVTQVDPRDLASNLIKYNPSLLKYIGKYQQTQSDFMHQAEKRQDKIVQMPQYNEPDQSIAELKRLMPKLDVNQDVKRQDKEDMKEQKTITNPQNIAQSVVVRNNAKLKQDVSKDKGYNIEHTFSKKEQGNAKTQSFQQKKYLNNNYNRKNVPQTGIISCHHNANQKSIQCASCINQMKRVIVELAERDPDLASRIYSSAQKSVLYKNYALNNYENAAMNPHNYRNNDGKLNIYQKQAIHKELK